MRRSQRWIILTLILIGSLCPATASTLLWENWKQEPLALGKTSLMQWNVMNGTNVDILAFGCFDLSTCVDLNGTGGNPAGDIQSKSTFLLAGGYLQHFSFDVLNTSNSSFRITIGTAYSEVFTPLSSGIINRTFSLPTNTFATIRITNLGTGTTGGIFLDNIFLWTSDSPIIPPDPLAPEPGSWALMGLGVMALGVLRRRTST